MEQATNHILLRGCLGELPRLSHENHGVRFFAFPLEVRRLSGNVDTLPVLVPEPVLCAMDLSGGDMLEVAGQIRTHNSRVSGGRRLVISVYAGELTACQGEPENRVELSGVVCREPVYRRTPLGREICDVMLAVNRTYHRTDYIPCIFWGRTASLVSLCAVGSGLRLTGRLQSRTYLKLLDSGSETRTAYEVSAMSAEVFQL